MNDKKIWLIGAGRMAIDYAKVLSALRQDFLTIGRREGNARAFEQATGAAALTGGLEAFLKQQPPLPGAAIVAVGVEQLAAITTTLLQYGLKKILLEKPGAAEPRQIEPLVALAKNKEAEVMLAYNRRFYASVRKAREIIRQDGGLRTFNFEFTEWSHRISKDDKAEITLRNWFLANSTHVVDTAFFLGGKPAEICCFHKGGLHWHPRSSRFAGAGVSESGALFAYQADWEAPGRWAMEMITRKHRLIFSPLEKLQVQEKGAVAIHPVSRIDYTPDEQYKPGLFLQVRTFLEGPYDDFCSLSEQQQAMEYYKKMSGY